MPLLGAFSCRPSVSPEPSAARMTLLILWMSTTGYCCRERQNSLFVLEYTNSRVWFLWQYAQQVGWFKTVTVYRLPFRLPAKSALTWPVAYKPSQDALFLALFVFFMRLVRTRTRMMRTYSSCVV